MRGEVSEFERYESYLYTFAFTLTKLEEKIVCKSLKRGNLGANDLYDEDEI